MVDPDIESECASCCSESLSLVMIRLSGDDLYGFKFYKIDKGNSQWPFIVKLRIYKIRISCFRELLACLVTVP